VVFAKNTASNMFFGILHAKHFKIQKICVIFCKQAQFNDENAKLPKISSCRHKWLSLKFFGKKYRFYNVFRHFYRYFPGFTCKKRFNVQKMMLYFANKFNLTMKMLKLYKIASYRHKNGFNVVFWINIPILECF